MTNNIGYFWAIGFTFSEISKALGLSYQRIKNVKMKGGYVN